MTLPYGHRCEYEMLRVRLGFMEMERDREHIDWIVIPELNLDPSKKHFFVVDKVEFQSTPNSKPNPLAQYFHRVQKFIDLPEKQEVAICTDAEDFWVEITPAQSSKWGNRTMKMTVPERYKITRWTPHIDQQDKLHIVKCIRAWVKRNEV